MSDNERMDNTNKPATTDSVSAEPKYRISRKIVNEHMRVYFSRAPLTEVTEPGIRGVTFEYSSPVLEAIMAMPGVEAATLYPYHAIVQLSPAFEWADFEPSILRLITSLNIGWSNVIESPA